MLASPPPGFRSGNGRMQKMSLFVRCKILYHNSSSLSTILFLFSETGFVFYLFFCIFLVFSFWGSWKYHAWRILLLHELPKQELPVKPRGGDAEAAAMAAKRTRSIAEREICNTPNNVRETGLEPAIGNPNMNLNHARLPIPPFPQKMWMGVDSNHRSR